MKIKCYRCDKSKDVSEFSKDSRMTRGYQGNCKQCAKDIFNTWYNSNKQETCAKKAVYKKENKGKINSINGKRRAAKLQRTPKWLTELHFQQIEMFYDSAAALTKELGIPMEVDHIVPLQGKNVSGLHVPWNLQVIPESENCSKNNRIQVESHARKE